MYNTYIIAEIGIPFDFILNIRCCTAHPFLVFQCANRNPRHLAHHTLLVGPIRRTIGPVYLWQREAEPSHAALVFLNGAGAVLLGVAGFAKKHALITNGFLVFAYAAWLRTVSPVEYSIIVNLRCILLGRKQACSRTWMGPRGSRWQRMLFNGQLSYLQRRLIGLTQLD
jgi:hypothetical protein